MKKWDVFNQCTCESMTKEDDWLDYIPRKGIVELELFETYTKECLKVTYKDGRSIFYENVFGTWGFPVEFV
ncbi:hypothetical protein [Eubacterium limosum]|uniref:hypothetical protein n=1 Tax=Eubacterium limosum TaxID=1736 RepID=UPI0010644C19|nr:hypothetical protein [Eubacterium limosum]